MKHIKKPLVVIFLLSAVFMYGQNDSIKKDLLGRSPIDTVRIDKFNNNHIDYTGQDLADATFPKSWPLFGSKARLSFGGYVKLDYIQDFNGVHNDRFELATANVHVDNSGVIKEEPYMNLFARESRFNFDFRTTASNGKPLRIFLEMDFWNLDRDPFHNVPRLRHFYAVYNRWLIGRSWGILTDVYSIATTLDFQAGDAIAGSRRAQLRYERAVNKSKTLKVAGGIEMLEYPDIDANDFDGQSSQLLPVFSARITKATPFGGRMMFGGSIYQLRWDGLETGPNARALGWGFVFSGRQNFSEKFGLLWNLSGGEGWGTNVFATLGSGNSAILTPDGDLETQFMYNLDASIQYSISSVLVTNIQGGYIHVDLSEFKGPNAYNSGAIGHWNFIWSPVKSINLGVEYQIAQRVNNDGKSGIANRIQISAKYIF